MGGGKGLAQATSTTSAATVMARTIAECHNCEFMKQELSDFYEEVDPAKLGNIDKIAQRFSPEELQASLQKKYNEAPDLEGALCIGEFEGWEGMRDCLVRFYEANDPAKLENVDKIVERFTPYELAEKLDDKYGTSPAFFAGDDIDVHELSAAEAPKRAVNGRVSDGWVSHTKSKHLKKNMKSMQNIKNARTSTMDDLIF
jgi:hypothetical protein